MVSGSGVVFWGAVWVSGRVLGRGWVFVLVWLSGWLWGVFWVSGLAVGLVAGVQAVSRWQGGRCSGGAVWGLVLGGCSGWVAGVDVKTLKDLTYTKLLLHTKKTHHVYVMCLFYISTLYI